MSRQSRKRPGTWFVKKITIFLDIVLAKYHYPCVEIEVERFYFRSRRSGEEFYAPAEPKNRLFTADFVLPQSAAGRRVRPRGGGPLSTEPGVRGKHPERAVPQRVCDEPPGCKRRICTGPAGGRCAVGGSDR